MALNSKSREATLRRLRRRQSIPELSLGWGAGDRYNSAFGPMARRNPQEMTLAVLAKHAARAQAGATWRHVDLQSLGCRIAKIYIYRFVFYKE